jgi:hypothetical protein
MIGLVLGDARIRLVELVSDTGSVLVLAHDRDRDGPLDGKEHALDRQAALVLDRHFVAPLHDLGVCDGDGLVLSDLEDEQPLQHADLGGREPDPARVDHEQLHPVDEPPQVVVELLHRPCGHLQRGVRVLADLRERKTSSSLLLGIELLLLDLSLDLRHPADCTLAEVDPKTLHEVMGQGATRPVTPRERRERETLEADLASSPVRGGPLRSRLRNFRPDPESGVRALGGPAAWMRRLRAIEDALDQHERQLDEAWRTLAEEVEDPAEFATEWLALADGWSFAEVNELIERHNRYFPAEARLAMDPRTRDFVRLNGRSYQREPLDAGWILDRFPADRAAALS